MLLIIFMVVTPMIGQGRSVLLPETSRPEAVQEGNPQLTVTLTAERELFIGEDWTPREQFEQTLRGLHERSPDRPLRIKADRSLPYRDVRDVLQAANDAGFSGAGLIVKRKASAGQDV